MFKIICAVDIESMGLDCTKYITGCLIKEGKNKPEIYRNKKKLWKRVIELGLKEHKRGKILNVYSHNATYDFYAYADLTCKNLKWFCHSPFIVAYVHEGKEIIKFLDSYAIFKMPLKEVGEMIGLKKMDMPLELVETDKKKDMKKIEEYMINDTRICLNSILRFKEIIKEEGINVKRLYTINQIAINHLINEFRKQGREDLFWNIKEGSLKFYGQYMKAKEIGNTKWLEMIKKKFKFMHGAYRGGRVECFKTGKHENVTAIDCNSLYPYSAKNIRFPNMETEKIEWKPDKEILKRVGISRVMMYNKKCRLGLLPIRTKKTSFIPKEGNYLIGTYTNEEIRTALKEGYILKSIEWTIHYDEIENPFKEIMSNLYEKRLKSEKFSYYFYKMMMNACIGKLAQRKITQELVIDSVENAEEYLKNKYEIIKGIKTNYLYSKDNSKSYIKKYYMPILPALINAKARIIMYHHFKKIRRQDLIYTDTDSIIYKGDYFEKFNMNKLMGGFKVEHINKDIIVYGKKTYMIGDKIKISGVNKKNLNKEDFLKGEVKDLKMITMKTTKDIKEVGTFKEETRDLKKQFSDSKEAQKLLNDEVLHIDCDIEDISFFLEEANEVLRETKRI